MTHHTLIFLTMALAACAYATELTTAQKLTPQELEQAHEYLKQTRDLVVGATKGLTESQWRFKPAHDRWSIAEIVEHMVLAQDLILGPIRQQLATAPAGPADRDIKQVDAIVISRFPDRTSKFHAPEILQPTGRWTPPAAMARLLENYDHLNEFLDSTPDLRQHILEAIPLKAASKGAFDTMDGYQWILATGSHIERHTKQILEVKADPNF
jgi:hypothetical protein